jgi:hypothetical protein
MAQIRSICSFAEFYYFFHLLLQSLFVFLFFF